MGCSESRIRVQKHDPDQQLTSDNILNFYYHESIESEYEFGKNILYIQNIVQLERIIEKATQQIRFVQTVNTFTKDEFVNVKDTIYYLTNLCHPNIIKIQNIYKQADTVSIVFNDYKGGFLSDWISFAGSLSEEKACEVFSQIISFIRYLHKHGILYRDLKPDTILVQDRHSDLTVIGFFDFQFCKEEEKNINENSDAVGALHYIAPEVLMRHQDRSSDIWAAGCILYTMVVGETPFPAETPPKVMEKILKGDFNEQHEKYQSLSDDLKILIKNCLQVKKDKRPTAREIFQFDWVRCRQWKMYKPKIEKFYKNLISSTNQLSGFNFAIYYYLLYIASVQFAEPDINHLFHYIDQSCDGQVSPHELKRFLKHSMDLSEKESIEKMEIILKKLVVRRDSGLLSLFDFFYLCHDREDFINNVNVKLFTQKFQHIFFMQKKNQILELYQHKYHKSLLESEREYLDDNYELKLVNKQSFKAKDLQLFLDLLK